MSKKTPIYFALLTTVFFLAVIDRHIINSPQTHGLFGNLVAPAAGLCLIMFPFAISGVRKSMQENKLATILYAYAAIPGILLLGLVLAYTIGLS
jgi:FtsH-binding integral membrane protein